MNIALWILQGLAAFVFLMAGGMKLIQPIDKLAGRMQWVKSFSPAQVRLIGTAEVVGALGLILPGVTGILPILTPIAAACLVVLMLGAVSTHLRLHEMDQLSHPAVPLILALLVAIGRIWILPLY
jgi:uncharacterized membrane protein YphA (DoxX/SURF4 family)